MEAFARKTIEDEMKKMQSGRTGDIDDDEDLDVDYTESDEEGQEDREAAAAKGGKSKKR